MPSSPDIASGIARNSALVCKSPGCILHRSRVGGHCFKHGRIAQRYGHPQGRRIRPKEYAAQTALVSEFIESHREHPAITAATAWINEWLTESYSGNTAVVAARELTRLYARGVTAVSILKTACALYLYSHHFPARLPDDMRLTYAISRAVLGLAPPNRTPSPSNPRIKNTVRYPVEARRGIGQRLRANLSALFANMVDALDRQEMNERATRDALRKPFGAQHQ